MRRWLLVLSALLVFVATPAHAKIVDLTASPNPAARGTYVRHTIELGAPVRLDLYVSASGFERPAMGTLPAGSWTYRCCPSQTAGTAAWFYRSTNVVVPGSYRFRALTRARGLFLSTVWTTAGSDDVWIRVT